MTDRARSASDMDRASRLLSIWSEIEDVVYNSTAFAKDPQVNHIMSAVGDCLVDIDSPPLYLQLADAFEAVGDLQIDPTFAGEIARLPIRRDEGARPTIGLRLAEIEANLREWMMSAAPDGPEQSHLSRLFEQGEADLLDETAPTTFLYSNDSGRIQYLLEALDTIVTSWPDVKGRGPDDATQRVLDQLRDLIEELSLSIDKSGQPASYLYPSQIRAIYRKIYSISLSSTFRRAAGRLLRSRRGAPVTGGTLDEALTRMAMALRKWPRQGDLPAPTPPESGLEPPETVVFKTSASDSAFSRAQLAHQILTIVLASFSPFENSGFQDRSSAEMAEYIAVNDLILRISTLQPYDSREVASAKIGEIQSDFGDLHLRLPRPDTPLRSKILVQSDSGLVEIPSYGLAMRIAESLINEARVDWGSDAVGTDVVSRAQHALMAVPEQQVGPVHFDIVDEILHVVPQIDTPAERTAEAAASARRGLISLGKTLAEQLGQSNCDPRLRKIVGEMQHKLEAHEDVIELGVLNLACEELEIASRDELGDAVAGILRGWSKGIRLFVGQFSVWGQFVEEAAVQEFDRDDVKQIVLAATEAIADLSQADNVDPEVPKTIALLTEALRDPGKALKRIAFAVVRTLENLVSRVYGHAGAILEAPLKGVAKGVEDGTATTVKLAVIAIALQVAVTLSPVAAKVADMNWMPLATQALKAVLKAGD